MLKNTYNNPVMRLLSMLLTIVLLCTSIIIFPLDVLPQAYAAADDYTVSGGDPGSLPAVGASAGSLSTITLTDSGGDDFADSDGDEIFQIKINTTDYPGVIFDTSVNFFDVTIGGTCGHNFLFNIDFPDDTTADLTVSGAGGSGTCGSGETVTIAGLRIFSLFSKAAPTATHLITVDNTYTSLGSPVSSSTTFSYSAAASDASASVTFSTPNVGSLGNTTLTLAAPFALDANDTIDITFPSNIDVSSVGSATTGTFASGSNITCTSSSQVVTCTTDGATGTNGTIIMTGLTASSASTNDVTDVTIEDEGVAGHVIATDTSVSTTDITNASNNIITDITAQDSNSNGKIDRFQVTIDNDSGYTAASHNTSGWSVTDHGSDVTVSSVTFSSATNADPLIIFVNLDESDSDLYENLTSVSNIELIYAQQGTDTGFEYNDSANTQLAAIATGDTGASDTENDGAAPVVVSRVMQDNNSDGQLDGVLVTFSEYVDASSLTSSSFEITTSTGATLTETYTDSSDDTTLFLGVSDAPVNNTSDLLKVKITGSVLDLVGNSASAESTSTSSTDGASPVLLRWSYDSLASQLLMQWTENISSSGFTPTALTIQNASTATSSYTLTGGSINSNGNSTLIIDLNTTDNTALDASTSIANSTSDSYLVITSSFVDDASSSHNSNIAVSNGSAMQASTVTQSTDATVTLDSATAGATSVTATVNFNSQQGVPVDGRIVVNFPSGFIVSGASSITNANINGTFSISTIGQSVIITRQGDGTAINPSTTNNNFGIAGITNSSTSGLTGTFSLETQNAFELPIDKDTSIPGVTLSSSLAPRTVSGTSGGGGVSGGSGGGVASSPTDSVTVVNNPVAFAVSTGYAYLVPIVTLFIYKRKKRKKARLTTEDGKIVISQIATAESDTSNLPRSSSQGRLTIHGDTTVTADEEWDGKIHGPEIQPLEHIVPEEGIDTYDAEEELEETSIRRHSHRKIQRESVNNVIKAGSDTSSLEFDKPVTLSVGLDKERLTSQIQDAAKLKLSTEEKVNSINMKVKVYAETASAPASGSCTVGRSTIDLRVRSFAPVTFVKVMEGNIEIPKKEARSILPTHIPDSFKETDNVPTESTAQLDRFKIDTHICHLSYFMYVVDNISFVTDSEYPFPDVSQTHNNAAAVTYLKKRGTVVGYPDGTYKPERSVNRAEFMKIIVEAKYKSNPLHMASHCFSDVPAEAWYSSYVCFGKAQGIIGGYGDGTFKPEAPINLAEASKILVNTLGVEKVIPEGDQWYSEYTESLSKKNYIPASFNKLPQLVDRGAMAEMVWRILENIQNLSSPISLATE